MEKMKTIKEQVYEVLRREILTGVHKPGDRIQELHIAERLDVSRSPVREAIKELIGEGLLVSVPNKSITVKKLTVREINEIFDFRNMTERYAIEKTVEHLDRDIKEKLRRFKADLIALHRANDLPSYSETDSDFHRFLIESSDNHLLGQVVGNVMALIEQFRIISLKSPQRFDGSVDEHVSIIDHILDSNTKAACRICSRHLDLARKEIISHLTRQAD